MWNSLQVYGKLIKVYNVFLVNAMRFIIFTGIFSYVLSLNI